MSAEFEIRLGDADWEKYGGPEWLPWDPDAFDDMEFDRLHKMEQEMRAGGGVSIMAVRAREIRGYTALGFRSVAWLARQLAGIESPSWDGFKIKPLQVRTRPVGDDADPPDRTSSPASSETAVSSSGTRPRSRGGDAPGK